MYRSVLVPLDGSAAAEHALPMGLSLARRFGAALQIVHVHVPIGSVHGEHVWFDGIADREIRDSEQAYIDAVIQRLAAVGDSSPNSALLDGTVASAIHRHAVATGVDLIVMTTHGRNPMARFWLGSVADALIRQTSIPILFVRPQEGEADLTREPLLERVQIPLDGSPLAEQILEPVAALATAMQAEVTLLRVVQQLTPVSNDSDGGSVSWIRPTLLKQLQEFDRQEWTRAEEYLAPLAERLRSRSLRVETRIASQVQPATAILDDASTHDVDLIAIATHGRGGLKRLLVGSVADKVLRGATALVLVQRPVGEFVSDERREEPLQR